MQKKILSKGFTEIEEDTVKSFENSYNGLETYLKNGEFIAGDSLTIADFSVLSSLTNMQVSVLLSC